MVVDERDGLRVVRADEGGVTPHDQDHVDQVLAHDRLKAVHALAVDATRGPDEQPLADVAVHLAKAFRLCVREHAAEHRELERVRRAHAALLEVHQVVVDVDEAHYVGPNLGRVDVGAQEDVEVRDAGGGDHCVLPLVVVARPDRRVVEAEVEGHARREGREQRVAEGTLAHQDSLVWVLQRRSQQKHEDVEEDVNVEVDAPEHAGQHRLVHRE